MVLGVAIVAAVFGLGIAWILRPQRRPDPDSLAAVARRHSLVRLVVTSKGGVVVETGAPEPAVDTLDRTHVPTSRDPNGAQARLRRETAEMLGVPEDMINEKNLPKFPDDEADRPRPPSNGTF